MNDTPLVELRIERPAALAAGNFLATAQDLQANPIQDGGHLAMVSDDLQDVKGIRKKIEERRVALKDPVVKAGREIDKLFGEMDAPFAEAERLIKLAITDFDSRERRRIAEEQRKADELARAEQARLREAAAKAEADAKAESDRLMKAAAKSKDAEKAAALQGQAQLAAAQGAAMAQALSTQAATTVAPTIAEATKVEGVGVRYDYGWECENSALVPREYLMLDEVAIGKVVRALKDKVNIPGIRVVRKPVVSARVK